MTEAEWLAGGDPDAMLNCLRGRASDRKLQLFHVAFVRERLYGTFGGRSIYGRDRARRAAIDLMERQADGQAAEEKLRAGAAELADEDEIVSRSRRA